MELFKKIVNKLNQFIKNHDERLQEKITELKNISLNRLTLEKELNIWAKNEEQNINSDLDKIFTNEMFSKSQITKDGIYQRIKNKFLGDLIHRIFRDAHDGMIKESEDISLAIELYIKSIMLAMYTIDNHNQLQEISELSKSVDRIFKLSKKQKNNNFGISCIVWYNKSKYWDIGAQKSPAFHATMAAQLKKQETKYIDDFEKALTKYQPWLDTQISEIENQAFFEEKVKRENFHVGSNCRSNNCKICLNFDGIDVDEYPIEKKIQPIPPVDECILKNEDDESLCDCWVVNKIIRIDLREQLEILDKLESGELRCKHEEGKEYVCKHCGILM